MILGLGRLVNKLSIKKVLASSLSKYCVKQTHNKRIFCQLMIYTDQEKNNHLISYYGGIKIFLNIGGAIYGPLFSLEKHLCIVLHPTITTSYIVM